MGTELLRIWERDKKTAMFVTHDIDEAIFLADRVVVMGRNPGHIKEVMKIDLPRPRTTAVLDSATSSNTAGGCARTWREDMASMQLVKEVA